MHQTYFQLALSQAKRRRGFCAPNPSVGAVVVINNQVIASGCHWASGKDHAEVVALKQINESAVGATLYVTLEPCCHHGKTPPCTDFIISRKIARVYYAVSDPNPQVAGKGEALLRAAGIHCEKINVPEIEAFYQSYQYWRQYHRPWVTAKLALSCDGKIAGEQGEPQKITGQPCQQFTHQWRQQSDAILTTAETIVHDNPQMNVRLQNKNIKKPIYILDSQLRLPLNARILETAKSLTVFCNETHSASKMAQYEKKHIRCIPIDSKNKFLNLKTILLQIGRDGIHDLWVEAGGRCFQSFFLTGLLNQAFIYFSPKQLGAKAKPAFTQSLDFMSTSANLNWHVLGDDLVCQIKF